MRGTCLDITDRVLADEQRTRISAWFESLVESAPDAILVLDEEQQIVECNRARPGDARGRPARASHPGDPASLAADRTHRQRRDRLDGRDLVLDMITTRVNPEDGPSDPFVAVYLRDAAPRLQSEAIATRLGEAHLRRRQALEINDNVVQGLVAAAYALEQGQTSTSMAYLDQTLGSAPGDDGRPARTPRRRGSPARRPRAHDPGGHRCAPRRPPPHHWRTPSTRKTLTGSSSSTTPKTCGCCCVRGWRPATGLTVVGEAADGLAAVELASELQPDLVMLDLAMPRMDGLEALPLIRAAVPGVRVIVLSGFNQSSLAEKALEAGADKYVVKGGSMRQLLELVETVLDEAS